MSERGPAEERIFLSAYERREFRNIEQRLASEDPGWAKEIRDSTADAKPFPLVPAMGVGSASFVLLGIVASLAVFVVLGMLGLIATCTVQVYRQSGQAGGSPPWPT